MLLAKQISLRTYTRVAGLLYLFIAIAGGWSIGYMPSLIVIPDNALQTVQNIQEYYNIFRLGIAGDIIVLLLEVILTVFLYRIFKQVNKTFALIATLSRMAMSIVMGLNLLNYLIPIMLVKDIVFIGSFEPEQINSLVLLFLKSHKYGEFIWQLFFSLHLLVLGSLAIKSNFVPKLLGYTMLIGSLGYASDCISKLLLIEGQFINIANGVFLAIATIGELVFTFWLLIRGVKPTDSGAQQITF